MTADAELAQAERRGWRGQVLGVLAFPLFFGAVTILRGNEFVFWEGAAAWVAVGAVTAVLAVLVIVTRAVPALHARQVASYRIQHALRTHSDPGAELRSRTDRQAQLTSGQGWAAWLVPFVVAALVLDVRWDGARTVVAGLVVVGLVAACMAYWRRQTAAARRWVQDPPGPSRRLDVQSSGARRRTILLLVLLLVGIVLAAVGLAVALSP